MTIGFLIPKAIFFIGISRGMLFAGSFFALIWCLGVLVVAYAREHKINVFAVIAVLMIFMRIAVVLASKSAALYLFAQAADSVLCGIIFLVSLFFPRSLIQILAEASGVAMPAEIRLSPFYKKAWQIITFVWGAAYMFFAVLLVTLNLTNLKAAAAIDIVAGWPFTAIMVAFTVIFPRWYWVGRIPMAERALITE
ncbi:MAG: hypothetical protein JXB40_00830 [Candidatus Omnitrophica bacterium]|nr:hypothetical protein [Candidatus Omnitrophota bacterium]